MMTQPAPNIDLGGTFAIIEERGDKMIWKILGRGFATDENARRMARKHKLPGVWIFDDLGDKRYITVGQP